MDEEHDAAYKQESDPRYDARTVAAKRAALEGAVAVYGSATPAAGELERRWSGSDLWTVRIAGPLPPVQIVDLRRERGYPLSAPLLAGLGRVVEHGGQRRSCCSTAAASRLRCTAAPAEPRRAAGRATSRSCSIATAACAATTAGTPRARPRPAPPAARPSWPASGPARRSSSASSAAATCPRLELIRLDADTAGKPDELAAALRRFSETDRSVLLGTQMVAKGHHFAGVALAAVVDADTGLALPDFRAEERTFQLVTQLAGRSGRDAPGRVIVQTFQPDARPILHAARHDVERFLAEELERRRELGYPPVRHLVRIVVSGRDEDAPLRLLAELKAGLPEHDLLGPASILRLRGRFRAQLVAKTDEPRRLGARTAELLAAAAVADARGGLTRRRGRRSAGACD